MTCPCGISLSACSADCDRDGTSERHDERLERLCPDCKAHQPEVTVVGTRIRCVGECGGLLEVRDHELVMVPDCDDCGRPTPDDQLAPIERWDACEEHLVIVHLCTREDGCADAERARQSRARRHAAHEAHCDDRGDEMRAGGAR